MLDCAGIRRELAYKKFVCWFDEVDGRANGNEAATSMRLRRPARSLHSFFFTLVVTANLER